MSIAQSTPSLATFPSQPPNAREAVERIRSQPALKPLLDLPIWACSGGTLPSGKPDKSPRDWRKPWSHAKSNDPATWGTFHEVAAAAEKYPQRIHHIGIMSSERCRVLDWDFKPHAETPLIVETQAGLFSHTYQETSLSGRGLRCLFLASGLDFKKRKFNLEEGVDLEIFASHQYAILTGNATSQEPLREAGEELLGLLAILEPPSPSRPPGEPQRARTGKHDNSGRKVWEVACEQWDLRATLENFGYKRQGDRYLAPQSTTGLAGVMVYKDPDGKERCYSNHSNDPLADGHTHDVFEAWTILAHGGDNKAAIREASKIFGLDRPVSNPDRLDQQQPDQRVRWDDPDVLMKGRQHLTSTGAHGSTAEAYSKLWHAIITTLNDKGQGFVVRTQTNLHFTPKGMTEIYARAGGRPVDRRQQLSFLEGQGMVGKLVRGEQGQAKGCWLLEMPFYANQLPMWNLPRGSL